MTDWSKGRRTPSWPPRFFTSEPIRFRKPSHIFESGACPCDKRRLVRSRNGRSGTQVQRARIACGGHPGLVGRDRVDARVHESRSGESNLGDEVCAFLEPLETETLGKGRNVGS